MALLLGLTLISNFPNKGPFLDSWPFGAVSVTLTLALGMGQLGPEAGRPTACDGHVTVLV